MKRILYLMLICLAGIFTSNNAFSQCGCTNCPEVLPDGANQDYFVFVGDDTGQAGNECSTSELSSVTINFDHTYLGDLNISLTGPDGVTITLVGPVGFTGGSGTYNLTFEDGAANGPWVSAGQGSTTDTYEPNTGTIASLGATSGACGLWTINVLDDQAIDTGNFLDFSLEFADGTTAASTTSTFACASTAFVLCAQTCADVSSNDCGTDQTYTDAAAQTAAGGTNPVYSGNPSANAPADPWGGNGSGTGCQQYGTFDSGSGTSTGGLPTDGGEVYSHCTEWTATLPDAFFPTFYGSLGATGGCFGTNTITVSDAATCTSVDGVGGVTVTQPDQVGGFAGQVTGLTIGTTYRVCQTADWGSPVDNAGAPCVPTAGDVLLDFCSNIVEFGTPPTVCNVPDYDGTTICSGDGFTLAAGALCDVASLADQAADNANTVRLYIYFATSSYGPLNIPNTPTQTVQGAGDLNTYNPGLNAIYIDGIGGVYDCTNPPVFAAGALVNENSCDPINAYFIFLDYNPGLDTNGDTFVEADPTCVPDEVVVTIQPTPQPPTVAVSSCEVTLTGCTGDVLTVTGGNGSATAPGNSVTYTIDSDADGTTPEASVSLNINVDNGTADAAATACPTVDYTYDTPAIQVPTLTPDPFGPFCEDDASANVSADLLPGEFATGSVTFDANYDTWSTESSFGIMDATGQIIYWSGTNPTVPLTVSGIPLNTAPATLGTFTLGSTAGVTNQYFVFAGDAFGDGLGDPACGYTGDYTITDSGNGGSVVLVATQVLEGTNCGGNGALTTYEVNGGTSFDDTDPALGVTIATGGATPITLVVDAIQAGSSNYTATTGLTDNNDGTATFDPATAGPGSHTITYNYTDANGCTTTDEVTTTVNGEPTLNGSAVCGGDATVAVTFNTTASDASFAVTSSSGTPTPDPITADGNITITGATYPLTVTLTGATCTVQTTIGDPCVCPSVTTALTETADACDGDTPTLPAYPSGAVIDESNGPDSDQFLWFTDSGLTTAYVSGAVAHSGADNCATETLTVYAAIECVNDGNSLIAAGTFTVTIYPDYDASLVTATNGDCATSTNLTTTCLNYTITPDGGNVGMPGPGMSGNDTYTVTWGTCINEPVLVPYACAAAACNADNGTWN